MEREISTPPTLHTGGWSTLPFLENCPSVSDDILISNSRLFHANRPETIYVFKASKFAEYSGVTETLTTTHKWLDKILVKKAWANKWLLSLHLKASSEQLDLTDNGKLFHSFGAFNPECKRIHSSLDSWQWGVRLGNTKADVEAKRGSTLITPRPVRSSLPTSVVLIYHTIIGRVTGPDISVSPQHKYTLATLPCSQQDSTMCPHCNGAEEMAENVTLQCRTHDPIWQEMWPDLQISSNPRWPWCYLK